MYNLHMTTRVMFLKFREGHKFEGDIIGVLLDEIHSPLDMNSRVVVDNYCHGNGNLDFMIKNMDLANIREYFPLYKRMINDLEYNDLQIVYNKNLHVFIS